MPDSINIPQSNIETVNTDKSEIDHFAELSPGRENPEIPSMGRELSFGTLEQNTVEENKLRNADQSELQISIDIDKDNNEVNRRASLSPMFMKRNESGIITSTENGDVGPSPSLRISRADSNMKDTFDPNKYNVLTMNDSPTNREKALEDSNTSLIRLSSTMNDVKGQAEVIPRNSSNMKDDQNFVPVVKMESPTFNGTKTDQAFPSGKTTAEMKEESIIIPGLKSIVQRKNVTANSEEQKDKSLASYNASVFSSIPEQNEEDSKGETEEGIENKQLGRKKTYTHDEDVKLIALVSQFGDKNWSKIAELMPGRNRKQIRDHYINFLKKKIDKKVFAPEEDELILATVRKSGHAWKKIADILPGRTPIMIKNRYNSKLKKKKRGQANKAVSNNDHSVTGDITHTESKIYSEGEDSDTFVGHLKNGAGTSTFSREETSQHTIDTAAQNLKMLNISD